MHTIQIEIEEPLYKEIIKKGIDIKKELEENIRKIVYAKETKASLQNLKEEKLGKLKKLKQHQDLEFADLQNSNS